MTASNPQLSFNGQSELTERRKLVDGASGAAGPASFDPQLFQQLAELGVDSPAFVSVACFLGCGDHNSTGDSRWSVLLKHDDPLRMNVLWILRFRVHELTFPSDRPDPPVQSVQRLDALVYQG